VGLAVKCYCMISVSSFVLIGLNLNHIVRDDAAMFMDGEFNCEEIQWVVTEENLMQNGK